MPQSILVTGATGKQGGAVVDALLAKSSSDFEILAVTRDTTSARAKQLANKSPIIKLIKGDLNDIPALFATARAASSSSTSPAPIWGVYSVQATPVSDKTATHESEVKQGKELVDQSIKEGVTHFVYSSVDRGGDEKSWTTPTDVKHFVTKHEIELHLRDTVDKSSSSMGWTILRPVAFMDNLSPGFGYKVFISALRDTLPADKPLQWVATKDIGVFAAEAFANPSKWNRKAVGLAGDSLTHEQLSQSFNKATGAPVGTTFGFLGGALKWAVADMGSMINWFGREGYGADIKALKQVHPGLMSMEDWLRQSAFVQGAK
jgi:uncharacterized protein YbjT (DUF2867 family)